MSAPEAPTISVVNLGTGVVRITIADNGADFYRVYRATSHAPTVLRLDDLDAGRVTDGVTEDTTYYYRAKAINIDVVDEEPVEAPSAYGPEQAIHTANDSDADDPDPTQALRLAERSGNAGGG
jgi:hypothetical protein